jgi:hypothetical protein
MFGDCQTNHERNCNMPVCAGIIFQFCLIPTVISIPRSILFSCDIGLGFSPFMTAAKDDRRSGRGTIPRRSVGGAKIISSNCQPTGLIQFRAVL